MPRIIPVLDVCAGRAVHAVAGDRKTYQPVRSILHPDACPIGLARAFRDQLGLDELYLADLDAIEGAHPSLRLIGDLVRLGLKIHVDAGVRSEHEVGPLLDAGVTSVICGLETLDGPSALRRIIERTSVNHLVFSLDLKDGRPLVSTLNSWSTSDPRKIAEIAMDEGIRRLILLDLARVGTGRGPGTLELASSLSAFDPTWEIILGGGIRETIDIVEAGRAGAAAVLVGTALHNGRIGKIDASRPGRGDSTPPFPVVNA